MRGLLVGRFQPFHRGHLEVVRKIRAARPREPLILVVGSAQESFTRANPLTAGERLELIDRCLSEAHLSEVSAVPLPDIQRHAQWAAYVVSMVPAFGRVYTNNPLTRLLFERAGFEVEAPELVERERFEGTHVRALLESGGAWHELVPPAGVRFLEELGLAQRLRLLGEGDAAPEGAAGA